MRDLRNLHKGNEARSETEPAPNHGGRFKCRRMPVSEAVVQAQLQSAKAYIRVTLGNTYRRQFQPPKVRVQVFGRDCDFPGDEMFHANSCGPAREAVLAQDTGAVIGSPHGIGARSTSAAKDQRLAQGPPKATAQGSKFFHAGFATGSEEVDARCRVGSDLPGRNRERHAVDQIAALPVVARRNGGKGA